MADRQAIQLRTKMLGAVLRQARTSAGRTLKETAAMIGVSSAVLASYERGSRGISLPELELLSYHLQVPLHRFLRPSRSEALKKPDVNPAVLISLRQHYIGAMIRSRRTEVEMSLRDLAKFTGVPAPRLSAYEQGDRPIPVPELEAIATTLNRDLNYFQDARGPVGEWQATQDAFEGFIKLPLDLRAFVTNPDSEPYLRMALRLSEIPVEKVRSLGEGFLELSL
jgi:transcriptional regulator with XRE-family HTH domain